MNIMKKMQVCGSIVWTAASLCTSGAISGAPRDAYSIGALPRPPLSEYSGVGALNSHGVAAGYMSTWRGYLERRGRCWDGGQIRYLGAVPGSDADFPTAVNDLGVVVGQATGQPYAAVVWYDETPEFLETLGGERSIAKDIDNNNVIVGEAEQPDGQPRAVRWIGGAIEVLETPGAWSTANAINSSGVIAGAARMPEGHPQRNAVVWDSNGVRALPEVRRGQPTVASALNDRGDVVGYAGTLQEPLAIWWHESGGKQLDPLPDDAYSRAVAINNERFVVGESTKLDGASTAVIWKGQKAIALVKLLDPGHGWTRLYGVSDVNDNGQIAGRGSFRGQAFPFLMTPYRCGKVRRLKTSCNPNGVIRVRLKTGMPQNTVLHLTIDDADDQTVFLDPRGRAMVRWDDQIGERLICIRECPDACEAVSCE